MPELPPVELVATLERLGLATAEQAARMGRRVGRLAKDLPRFDSVWIDALAQARVLTPFQAAELNAGRGNSLRLGPYLLCQRLAHPSYVACYRAKNVESGETVRLAIVENAGPRADAILEQLKLLLEGGSRTVDGRSTQFETSRVESPQTCHRRADAVPKQSPTTAVAGRSDPIPNPQSLIPDPPSPSLPLSPSPPLFRHVGRDTNRIFVAEPWINGRTAAEWIVHHGRFPPEVVLEIARAMLAELVELEKSHVCHSDVSTSSLMLTDSGDVVLTMPGLRAILRPEEGYAFADLLPEAFDSLAPERIASGTPPNVPGDIYACGCVWWHLLCGRPPLAGGDSLTKLRAAQAGGICDVRRYAPDVPPPLAAAISACVEVEPSRRPESMARLAATLGSPTSSGKGALADCLARSGRPTVHWTTTTRSIRRSSRTPLWLAGAVCCLAAVVATLWPVWHARGLGGSPTSKVGSREGSGFRGQGSGDNGQCETASGSHPSSLISHPSSFTPDSPPPSNDSQNPVVPATFQQPLQPPPDLVLAADKPLPKSQLELRAGQRVRAASGHRAVLLVPETGLVVDKENVCFENIDFVWNHASSKRAKTDALAIVRLLAGRAEFRGCSFRCVMEGIAKGNSPIFADTKIGTVPSVPVSAIRWVHPAEADRSETSLPTGQIRLADCLLVQVDAGLDCQTLGSLSVEATNTLHLGAGPFLRLDHCPRADEPASLNLSQVTLRGGGPLLECLTPRVEQQPGEIAVFSAACVFAPQSGEPLVRCSGTATPERLTRCLRWTGQGSLVTPNTPILTCQGPDEQPQTVDEASLAIAGLVRSEVGFAGELSSDPAASRVIRWQAPLRSSNPPGVDPAPLPCPSR